MKNIYYEGYKTKQVNQNLSIGYRNQRTFDIWNLNPKSVNILEAPQLRDTYYLHMNVLTQEDEVAIVLQHHVSVQALLSRIKQLPLLRREVHSHILKRDLEKRITVKPEAVLMAGYRLSSPAWEAASPTSNSWYPSWCPAPLLNVRWPYWLTSMEIIPLSWEPCLALSGGIQLPRCEAVLWRRPGREAPRPANSPHD